MQRIPTTLLTLALAFTMASAAAAETPTPSPQPQQPTPRTPTPQKPTPQTPTSQKPMGTRPSDNTDTAANRVSDAEFAQKAAMGGRKEVETAKVAAGKASSDGVKAFADQLVKDHTAANEELASLMKTKQMTASPAPKTAAPEAWRNQSGAAFDRAFLDHAIEHHQKDIALFEAEAKNGTDAELKTWAEQKLPTLREHLKTAQDLKTRMGTTRNQ